MRPRGWQTGAAAATVAVVLLLAPFLDRAGAQTAPSIALRATSSAEGTVRPGQAVSHEISVENDGLVAVRRLVLVARFSPAVRVADLDPSFEGGSCTVLSAFDPRGRLVQSVICQRSILAAGDTAAVRVELEVVEDARCGPALDRIRASARRVAPRRATVGDEVRCLPSMWVSASAPRYAHEGATIEIVFVVRNDGRVPLDDLTVTAPVCGDAPSSPSPTRTLVPGATRRFGCRHVVSGGRDPVVIDAVASGFADGERVLARTRVESDVAHPGIDIEVRSPARPVHAGDRITVVYRVTNAGDVPIHRVALVDRGLGVSGSIAWLAPGTTRSLSRTRLVSRGLTAIHADAVVRGNDPTGLRVEAIDGATIRVRAASGTGTAIPDTPFTGLDAADATALAVLLALIGVLVLLAVPRRRSTR